MSKKIMIVGYGSAGSMVLDFIIRMPELQDCEFIVMSRKSEEESSKRLNTTIVSAGIMNFYPKVKYISCDLLDIDKTAGILSEECPDIIAYTGRFISGIKYGAYSYPNNLGYGVWLPLAAPLIYKLCLAVEKCEIDTKIINTSFPDGVCPLLWSAGYTDVVTGAGNLNHLIPRMKKALSDDPNEITDLKMVGSHYLNTYVSKEGSPRDSYFYVEYYKNGKIHSSENNNDYPEIIEAFKKCRIPMESGHTRNLMIASDVSQIIKIMITGSNELIHLPGVSGYVGGYPCRWNKEDQGFCIEPMKGISSLGSIKINQQSIFCDGIEDISEGEVTFSNKVIRQMKNIFNIEYPKTISLEDLEDFAYEIKNSLINYDKKVKA